VKEIALSDGSVALVDDVDFDRVSQHTWRPDDQGYAVCDIKIDGIRTTAKMHRIVMNAGKGVEIDHENTNRLDNQRHNLRLATRSQNMANSFGHPSCRRSSFKGVGWFARISKWTAQITVRGKKVHLGYFTDEREAAAVYNTAAKKYFGQFARLNTL
jgi:hypothetical protein